VLIVVYAVAFAVVPLYAVFVSVTLGPTWRRSRSRATALVFPLLPLLAFLAFVASPMLDAS
jgi:hypothetical protein